MNLLFFDTETTGLPIWQEPSESEGQPHIVQLAALVVDKDSREVIDSMDAIIRPEGWSIPKEMTDIHGITNEIALEKGVPESVALEMFLNMWNPDIIRIAHNHSFDARIIRIATKRFIDDENIQEAWKDGKYEDTALILKPIMQLLPKNRYGFKTPKLVEAYNYFFGKDPENMHTAMGDAKACMEIYFAIQDKK